MIVSLLSGPLLRHPQIDNGSGRSMSFLGCRTFDTNTFLVIVMMVAAHAIRKSEITWKWKQEGIEIGVGRRHTIMTLTTHDDARG